MTYEEKITHTTLDDEQQVEMMAKYDREFAYRKLKGIWSKLVFAIAVIWSSFQLYTALFGSLPPLQQRSIHVGFAMVLIYLLYPMSKKDHTNKIKFYDFIFVGCAIYSGYYLFANFNALMFRAGAYNKMDVAVSCLAVIIVVEATRRVAGRAFRALVHRLRQTHIQIYLN